MFNDFYYKYEYIPEIASFAVPKEQQEQAYNAWQGKKTKENMNNIVRTFGKLINSEISRYQGTLSRPLLMGHAKKFVVDAVKTFDPKRGNQLSTHIVGNLMRLHRLNYQSVQGLKSSEEIQSKMNSYFRAKDMLSDSLGREPTEQEIADEVGVSLKFLKKMRENIKLEKDPGDTQSSLINEEDYRMRDASDYIYYDLPPLQKKIFEYRTGYNGTKILPSSEIAKKLDISPVRVSQVSNQIGAKFKKFLGES